MRSKAAIIPARGGSKRLPRKNLASLGDVPIIVHVIQAALAAGCFERVVVSTEDDEIASISEEAGAEVRWRPELLATDSSTVAAVCMHVLDDLLIEGQEPDWFCCLYPTAAFIRADDITISMEQMLEDVDGVMGVSKYGIHPYKAMSHIDGYLEAKFADRIHSKSQLFETMYASNGTLYWMKTRAFRDSGSFYPRRLAGYAVPPERGIDIDTPADLDWARLVWRALNKKK